MFPEVLRPICERFFGWRPRSTLLASWIKQGPRLGVLPLTAIDNFLDELVRKMAEIMCSGKGCLRGIV